MNDPVDGLEAELARFAEREPTVRAWVARRSDDELRALVRDSEATTSGPLRGWTLGVKDVIDTHDFPTERGSPIYRDRRPTADAACVALARAVRAVIAGKTTTTEFALFAPTVTTNPHDPERTPGGSSSGSAAAVAAGMVRAAFGTQTVGSVLRPAAFCGVVGFKGTFGFVPLTGVGTLAHSLDTLGWLTRDVHDAATLYHALTGDQPATAIHPPRLGLYRSHQWEHAQPELEPMLGDIVAILDDAGAEIVELDPSPHLQEVSEAGEVILAYEAARVFAWERATQPDLIHPWITRLFERGDATSPERYHWARRVVADAAQAHDRWLGPDGLDLDALLTPSAPGEAPAMTTTGDSVFNRVWSTLGTPAVNVPVRLGPSGLPLGVQLTAPRWADAQLRAVAAWVERTRIRHTEGSP
ncbi:MAG: amidase [Actinomycetota bacterium]|nr:amidase [Actinomycetota bacterium]